MKKVLVIIVTYNGRHWLQRCLGSVPPEADLYVFDNDSTDGSADFVAAHFPQAKLVRSAENFGFSIPNNLGMRWALDHGYDYVYLLNQDAWLEAGALEKLLAAAEAHPDYAVLSPLQMTDGFQALDAQFAKCLPRSYENAPLVSVPRIMAAHWLIPVSAIRRLGLFAAELFPHWGQDDEWCQRARLAGLQVGVVPGARAVHDRARREEPLETLVKRNYYTASLLHLTDARRPLWMQWAYVCLFTLVKALKYRSFLPFKYFRQLLRQGSAVREQRALVRTRAHNT